MSTTKIKQLGEYFLKRVVTPLTPIRKEVTHNKLQPHNTLRNNSILELDIRPTCAAGYSTTMRPLRLTTSFHRGLKRFTLKRL